MPFFGHVLSDIRPRRVFLRGFGRAFFYFIKGDVTMEKQYFEVFNKITDIIEDLKKLQTEMEEMYISSKQKETAQYGHCAVL